MRHPLLATASAIGLAGVAGLAALRARTDAETRRMEAHLTAPAQVEAFSPAHTRGLPEPARRYLLHAIAPGTPLAPACVLEMDGRMASAPGAPPLRLTAVETLAPRSGFVWSARATMRGVPVHVRDHYHAGSGGLRVAALGLVPLPSDAPEADVTRSARGRLVAEAVWCPTALVHPAVAWEASGADRARFTLAVDGEPVAVDLRLAPDGGLREVALLRWGDADGEPWRALPYGFRVDAEATFGGVTIPGHITGGWRYGTDRFREDAAASFTVRGFRLAGPPEAP